MGRFYHNNSRLQVKYIASLVMFIAFFIMFFLGISSVSSKTNEKQSESLELAISRGIAHCYATNGHYPEDLTYLVNNYGIIYDSNKYFVDYTVLGENIFPEVTVIEK